MRYSKEKARLRKVKILEIETSLKLYQEKCSTDPSAENFEQLKILKSTTQISIILQRELFRILR